LAEAQLQDVSLREAQLQGADLKLAQLQGADLGGAQMQGADLAGAAVGGARFDDAVVFLADLRDLDRTLVTDADVHKLARVLERGVPGCEKAPEDCRYGIRADVGRPDTLEWAADTSCMLCERIEPFLACTGSQSSEAVARYTRARTDYLARLGCADRYVRMSFLGRLRRLPETRSRWVVEGARFANALLSPDCPRGGDSLPGLLREQETWLEKAVARDLLNVKKMEPETTQPLAVSERHDGGRSFLARGPRSSTAQGASNLGHRVRKSWLTAFFMLWGGESIAMTVRSGLAAGGASEEVRRKDIAPPPGQ
jgi:hypothetical protein